MKNKFNNPYTRDQGEIIRILASRGWRSRDVGERLGRTGKSVRDYSRSNGIRFLQNGERRWVGVLTE